MNDFVAPAGHNQPTAAQSIQENLKLDHQALVDRIGQLVAAVDRVPETIEDDETSGKVTDFIKQLTATNKDAEAKRVAAKEPYLDGSRAVDGWFKTLTDPLMRGKREIEGRLTIYLRQKEEAERRARAAEAERLRLEAEAKAAAAKTEADMESAIKAESRAETAAAKVETTKAADLSRTRGAYGGVSSLRTTWTFEVVDEAKVPKRYLMVDRDAVKAAIKRGEREIAGLRIYEETAAVVR